MEVLDYLLADQVQIEILMFSLDSESESLKANLIKHHFNKSKSQDFIVEPIHSFPNLNQHKL